MTERVFISYSRHDEALVRALADVQTASGVDVSVDTRFLTFGERWSDGIRERILASHRMLVFWSRSAAASEEVRKEYEIGLAAPALRVVPVLLDDTPLPPALRALHGVTSLRPLYRETVGSTPLAPRARRVGSRTSWAASGVTVISLAAISLAAVAMLFGDKFREFFQRKWSDLVGKNVGDPDFDVPAPPPPEPPPTTTLSTALWSWAIPALVFVLVVGGIWWTVVSRRRSRRDRARRAWDALLAARPPTPPPPTA